MVKHCQAQGQALARAWLSIVAVSMAAGGPAPERRVMHQGTICIDDDSEAHSNVARLVVERLWQDHAAEHTLLQTMDKDRDGATMAEFRKQIRSPQGRAMLETLHADSVSTPARAHMRWGYVRECPQCGGEQADRGHVVDRCPQTQTCQRCR